MKEVDGGLYPPALCDMDNVICAYLRATHFNKPNVRQHNFHLHKVFL